MNSAIIDVSSEQKMKTSLRKTLVDSHVAAITIAMLLLISGTNFVLAFREPAIRVGTFLATAVAILDIPYIPHSLDPFTRMKLMTSAIEFAEALLVFCAAWILSRCTYGIGPLSCLRSCRTLIRRTNHVQ